MITAKWGTPEYNQQQQAMWNQQAAAERQRQEAANQQMRQRRAEQQAQAAAQRRHQDMLAGISGLPAPMHGNYDSFRHGRNIAGRDHKGNLPSYWVEKTPVQPIPRRASSGGDVTAALILLGILVLGILAAAA